MIKLFLQELNMYISLLKFKRQWRRLNKENNTVPINIFQPNQVIVGKYSYGQLNVKMFGDKNHILKIGSCVSIAEGCKFLLSGEHSYKNFTTFPVKKYILNETQSEPISKGNIEIQDDVWIGENSIILSGVTIGQGAVVAAGSVISKDVPAYSIVVSNKIIKKRFSDDIINQLMKINYSKLTLNDYRKIDKFSNIEEFIKSEVYKKIARETLTNEIN
ncbi:CatB-related O-acetyltransferase [Streptococcus porcinus]